MDNKKQKETETKAKRFSSTLLTVLIILISLLFVFTLITNEIVIKKEPGFDFSINEFFTSFRNPVLSRAMVFFTFFGSRSFLLPAYIIIVTWHLFFKKNSKSSLGIAAVALSGAGILFLFKNIFRRERPESPLIQKITSFSYPSGHSFSAFTFAGVLIYLILISNISSFWKLFAAVFFFLFAAFIACSRVYLLVHYASDVIAGFCLSFLWLSICYFVLVKCKLISPI